MFFSFWKSSKSISDHFSVLFNLIIGDPSSVPKVKLARDMRSFSYTKFEDDLSIKLNKITLQQDPNTLLQHYELAVGSALDVQAPIKSRTMKCRLRHPWYNDSIHLAREIRRANENKWNQLSWKYIAKSMLNIEKTWMRWSSRPKWIIMSQNLQLANKMHVSVSSRNWHRCLEECFLRLAVLKSCVMTSQCSSQKKIS